MRKTLFLLAALFCLFTRQLSAQGLSGFCNAGACFQQNPCYADNAIDTASYVFALADNIFGNPASYQLPLRITVYSPCTLPGAGSVPYNPGGSSTATVTPSCSGCKRPFILLVHGGGFRFGCRSSAENECREFAKRGYVAATIDYRLGWILSQQSCYTNLGANQFCTNDVSCLPTSICQDSTSMHAATYKAFQDGFAALRYMAYYAAQFNIDTNYFYTGGQSAGAIVADNISYMTQAEFNNALPDLVNSSGHNVLGGCNTHGNSLAASYKIKGVYNCWGALADANYIRGTGDRIPLISFHCKDDLVVPYGNDGINLAAPCSSAQLGRSDGSEALYNRIRSLYPGQVATEFYHQDTGGHGGILTANPAQNLKRIELAVCFFRKCAAGYTAQVDFDLTNGDNTTVDCTVAPGSSLELATTQARRAPASAAPVVVPDGRSVVALYSLAQPTRVSISVYDLNGRSLETWNGTEAEGPARHELGRNLTPGMYLVTVSYNGQPITTTKVAINH